MMIALTPNQKNSLLIKLLNLFESERFAKWYKDDGRFDLYVSEGTITTSEILSDIEKFLDI
jgi:hypothetical protein